MKFLDELVPRLDGQSRRRSERHSGADRRADTAVSRSQPWDWEFYSEQVRKAKYDLDESEIKPYFELNSVLQNGVFYAANQLYGLTFKERQDIPVYQPDVRVFEVFDADGKPLALWYCDYFKRDNKNGGAWMDELRAPVETARHRCPWSTTSRTLPSPRRASPRCSASTTSPPCSTSSATPCTACSPTPNIPALRARTCPRLRRIPVAVQRALGQLSRRLSALRAALQNRRAHARRAHGEDREVDAPSTRAMCSPRCSPPPSSICSGTRCPPSAPLQNPDDFEKQALKRTHLALSYVPPRYRSSYFLHIWANGYAAGYYAYLWSEMLDDDAFQWFEDHGGMTRANGDRFRKMVLSRGNTEDLPRCTPRGWEGTEHRAHAQRPRPRAKSAGSQ